PGYLRNYKDLQVGIGMLASVMQQLVCNLFGSRHARIRENTATKSFREVSIENQSRKISAVVVEEIEVRSIRPRVQFLDERIVLFRRGVEPKCEGTALV